MESVGAVMGDVVRGNAYEGRYVVVPPRPQARYSGMRMQGEGRPAAALPLAYII